MGDQRQRETAAETTYIRGKPGRSSVSTTLAAKPIHSVFLARDTYLVGGDFDAALLGTLIRVYTSTTAVRPPCPRVDRRIILLMLPWSRTGYFGIGFRHREIYKSGRWDIRDTRGLLLAGRAYGTHVYGYPLTRRIKRERRDDLSRNSRLHLANARRKIFPPARKSVLSPFPPCACRNPEGSFNSNIFEIIPSSRVISAF